MQQHEIYMARCLSLARLGEGAVAPNPMVGSVLVHHGTIIGEGYHQQYGGPHAEVHCINSVEAHHQQLIKEATIYVSLEPCAHYGKTPPCADLIINSGIRKAVIACRDSYEAVNGRGVQKLLDAGVEVITGVLEQEAIALNKRFFCFHNKQRPYIFLKWAATHDGYVAPVGGGKIAISNPWSQRFSHHLRATEAAIMVGAHTALHDNPALTPRNWPGRPPLRIVTDRKLKLPANLKIFTDGLPTIVLNEIKEANDGAVRFVKIPAGDEVLQWLMHFLYEQNISSLIVEGGPQLQQSFIDAGLWDEALHIENTRMILGEGIKAVSLAGAVVMESFSLGTDRWSIFKKSNQST